METYETYEWFEQCRVLPNIKSTTLPKMGFLIGQLIQPMKLSHLNRPMRKPS